VQVRRRFGEAFRAMLRRQQQGPAGALTPFQAFMTALAATIGTGNIAGVATAIVSGGPGALFWIWVYGFFATAIKFSEAVLGLTFRESQGDRVRRGRCTTCATACKSPWLAIDLRARRRHRGADDDAVHAAQLDRAGARERVRPADVGGGRRHRAVLTWLVIIGGIKSIGRAAEKLSPLKVGSTCSAARRHRDVRRTRCPTCWRWSCARRSRSRPGGGALGLRVIIAIRYGLARGIYANEAGYGTAAVAYGTAKSDAARAAGAATP
jgi:alanine or glycine:cation symporter, AGCS family